MNTQTTRLLAWNILQGGNPRIPDLLNAIAFLEPDLVVLSEVRASTVGTWRDGLAALGLGHQTDTTSLIPATDRYSLLVATKTPHEHLRWPDPGPFPNRVTAIDLDGTTVVSIHAPYADVTGQQFYESLSHATDHLRATDAAIIGDFNTDQDGLRLSPYLSPIITSGWTHALRHHNPDGDHASWWSSAGTPFAIDHCLLSPTLTPRLRSAALVDAIDGTVTAGPGLRTADGTLSDHRPLLIDLDLAGDHHT